MKRDVVNREQSLCSGKRRVSCISCLQVSRQKTCHPVIQVNDIKAFAERLCQLKHGAAEKSESLGVVSFSVEFRSREVFRCVYEVNRNFPGTIDINGYASFTEIERHREFAGHSLAAGFDLFELVTRHNDPDLVSEPGKGFRKGACYICQSAGFCERDNLRRRQ